MDTKKLGAALLTGVLAASMLAGCGSDKKDSANDTKKPLRVATNATFVPFEFKDNDQSTEYKGFEMDLIRAVAKEMGRMSNSTTSLFPVSSPSSSRVTWISPLRA